MGVVAQIREALPLLDYLNQYQGLGISESELPKNISCPLHKDNKPSMRLYRPKENGAYCFSCGKAFDAISMHQALNGMEYKDAVKELAKGLGIKGEYTPRFEGQRQAELVEAIKANTALLKEPRYKGKMARNFDIFARKVYQAVKTGKLKPLTMYVSRKEKNNEK